jgi:hypothetical protein
MVNAGRVVHMRNGYRMVVGKADVRRPLEVILQWAGFMWHTMGSCEHGYHM